MPDTLFTLPLEIQARILSYVCDTDLNDGSRALRLYRGKITYRAWDTQAREVTTPLAHVAIVAFPFMTLIANVLARYELSAAKKAWVPQPAIHELRVKLERWTHLKNQGKLGCAVASPASNFNKSQELGKEAELSEVAARKMKGNGKTKGKGKGKKVVLWTIGAGT